MRQAIEAGVDQRLGVVQIENMRRNLDAVLMGVGDNGFAQFNGNLLFAAQMIVHPNLDDVDFLIRQVRDVFVHITRRGHFEGNTLHALGRGRVTAGAREAAASREDARFMRAGGVLRCAQLEDQVIDHVEIVQEVQRKVGKIGVVGKKATYNPKTKKWFAFADNFVPDPVVWRHDYWNGVGIAPSTWDNVRKAAPKLKAAGHPIGIGQSAELDSNMALIAFMMCFGAYVQDAKHRVTIKSKHTVEAVKFMADIFKSGETDEIFGWQPASNNNFLYSGKGSMILNAISATRTPEDLGLPFADQLYIYPIPKGPVQRLGLEHVMGSYSIWKFAQNIPAAKQFMADLEINYKDAFVASKFYNFPTFPGALPFKRILKLAAGDTHKPRGKYQILTTIAQKYTVNPGYPGYTNAAFSEVFGKFLVPKMFAQVSQGKMSAADAVSAADHDFKDIYAKWRKLGKI